MTGTPAPSPVPEPLRSIAVIGAGQRGREFALRCVQAGYDVVLEDVLSSNLRKAEEQYAETGVDLPGTLRLAASVEEAVRDADLSVDFVPDELESKLEIFSMMDRMAPPRTIFCTPTALSISDLASCTYRPALCLALEGFVGLAHDSVRLVRGAATSDASVQQATRVFMALGDTVEVTADTADPALVRP